jgi:hypothetical protein
LPSPLPFAFTFLLRLVLRRAELFEQRPGPEVALKSVTDDLVIDFADLKDMFGLDEDASERRRMKLKHLADNASQLSVHGEAPASAAGKATWGSLRG